MEAVFLQAGAIAYRIVSGKVEILLISTSSGRHWTIPKGLIDPGFSAEQTVHNEAWEEAGIRGALLSPPIGTYRFKKWGGICAVTVYLLSVTHVEDAYLEADMRRRLWLPPDEAARRVKYPELGRLIDSARIHYK